MTRATVEENRMEKTWRRSVLQRLVLLFLEWSLLQSPFCFASGEREGTIETKRTYAFQKFEYCIIVKANEFELSMNKLIRDNIPQLLSKGPIYMKDYGPELPAELTFTLYFITCESHRPSGMTCL